MYWVAHDGVGDARGLDQFLLGEFGAEIAIAVGDPRQVVRDSEARYFGSGVEEHSLVPLGEARLGHIGLDEWLRRSQTKA